MYGHDFRAIDALQLLKHHVVVALLVVELVDEEDDRFSQLFGVAEVVLRAHLHAILAVEQQYGGVCHVERRDGGPDEVVAARAVDDVQLLAVPFHVEYGREHRVAILLFYWEIVTNCVFGSNPATAFYNTTLIEQGFRESGFS